MVTVPASATMPTTNPATTGAVAPAVSTVATDAATMAMAERPSAIQLKILPISPDFFASAALAVKS